MTDEIPTHEPARIRAGDTIKWLKTLNDYSAADGWVLSYRLINSNGKFDISSTASGADHLITISAATTANYFPGDYTLFGWVTKSSERFSIPSSKVHVFLNLAALTSGYDIRSTARKILDLLDAAMLSHGNQAWVQEYEIEGRRMRFKSIGEFIAYRSKIKQEVNREENAERLRNGLSLKNKINVRF